jgi:hypothetical protein
MILRYSSDQGDTAFAFSTAGATATARESDGFVVLAGSTARRQGTETFPAGYQALRDQLVQDGRLVDGPSPGADPPPCSGIAGVIGGLRKSGHVVMDWARWNPTAPTRRLAVLSRIAQDGLEDARSS